MKHIWVLILMTFFIKTQAQRFYGGIGSGYRLLEVVSFVGGGNPNAKYIGGSGIGFNSSGIESFIQGGNPNAKYTGGNGEGFSSGSNIGSFMAGGNPNIRFVGGTGTGYTAVLRDGFFLDGGNPNIRYIGGSGIGYQMSTTETFTSGGNPNARFGGGMGNGFHSVEGQLNIALPVVLIQFEAFLIGQQVELTWATAQEKNNQLFEIQRSVDLEDITTIQSVAGSERSLNIKHYKVYDEQPLSGKSYYRLKQIDQDGSFDYSKWVVIQQEASKMSGITLAPNPATDIVRVELDAVIEKVMVTDLNGRECLTTQANKFDVSGLDNGIYLVRVMTKAGWQTIRLSVVH